MAVTARPNKKALDPSTVVGFGIVQDRRMPQTLVLPW